MQWHFKLGLIGLFSLVIFFGLFRLTESPSLVYDEGWYFQTSANLATTGVDGLQFVPSHIEHLSTFVTVGYPVIYPLGLWFKIFSVGVFQGRLLMVFFLITLVVAGYCVALRLYGHRIALAVLALLATFPPLYGNGKSVMGEVPGLLFLVLFLLCFNLMRTGVPRKSILLMLSGLFAGLCIATKPIFILLIPALCIGILCEWKRKTLSWKDIAIGGICTFIPLFVWFVVQFKFDDSLTEILTYYANPYSIGNISEIIIANIGKLFSDVGTLYTMMLTIVWGITLVLRWKHKEKVSGEEIIGFIFSLLIIAAFLRTAGFYRYLFPAQIIALIFFPYSVAYISTLISKKYTWWPHFKVFTLSIFLLAVMGAYQLSFNSWVADAYPSKKTAYWYEYFENIPESVSVFFYNTPEVVPFIRHRNYFQHLILYDRSLGNEGLPMLTTGVVDKVIVQTNLFTENKEGVFDQYVEEQKAYKYSILKKR